MWSSVDLVEKALMVGEAKSSDFFMEDTKGVLLPSGVYKKLFVVIGNALHRRHGLFLEPARKWHQPIGIAQHW